MRTHITKAFAIIPGVMDVEATLKSLTLEEKITLLAGGTFSTTTAIPDKGVPFIKTADGPNGIRAAPIDRDVQSACFPAACSIAATFDKDIAYLFGTRLALEARQKDVHCVLGPTVCMHRHPLGGRNFESYSEDPLLTGKMAAQTIRGLQDHGVSATIKHFVANEQETERNTVDETISERALREIYLKPFEIAVREANPWAVMTAYNLVNGVHCDENEWLIKDILRGEWNWDGLVMSDWGGTNSVATALNAGLDLEMPGPPRKRRLSNVLEAVKAGEMSEATVDERARNVLRFVSKLTKPENDQKEDVAVNQAEDGAFIRDAGARGMVLLKNERHTLPLSKKSLQGKKIALIGLAKDAMAHGGGSAAVNAYYKVTPWDAMQREFDGVSTLIYAKGFHRDRLFPPINQQGLCGTPMDLSGTPGFTRLLYDFDRNRKISKEEPSSTQHGYPQSAYSPLGSQESLWRSLELVGDFTPAESGRHYIACSGLGPTTVMIDGEILFEQYGNSEDPMGSLFLAAPEKEMRHQFHAGQTYRIRIRSDPPVGIGLDILEGRSGVRVGMVLESVHDEDLLTGAVKVASEADVAIVFTGHDPQWESEGRDQESFHLPRNGSQDAVAAAVAKANANTIVVNSTGVAIAMPWLHDVRAVIQAWFPGQECGNSIVDVLTGKVNPEGRLPVSFPKRIEDAPAFGNFPGENVGGQLKVKYVEGVFMGYRHYDLVAREHINFPFGHGLSYTTFAYSSLLLTPRANGHIVVCLDVSNTGPVRGATTIQIYVGSKEIAAGNPVKVLVGFQKVRLEPGQTTDAQVEFHQRDFARFDEQKRQWVIDSGEYMVYLGDSAASILQIASFSLSEAVWTRKRTITPSL